MMLLGDFGRFLTTSDTLEVSEEWEVQVWSRPILLGDEGRADSWLWEETCEWGLAKRPTVEGEDKNKKISEVEATNYIHYCKQMPARVSED